VFWHLGENAIKYSPDGGLIRLDVEPVGGQRVAVTVSDEGVGVPTDIDLFAPFTRAANDRGIQGTGLGLHIVHTLLAAMDGTVTALPGLAGGSVMTVTLPLAP
jgi:signal transduction histidine kinase